VAIEDETARGRPSGTAGSSGYGSYHLFLLIPMLEPADTPALSFPRIDDLFLSVNKTKVPRERPVERNRMFIGEPRRLHTCHAGKANLGIVDQEHTIVSWSNPVDEGDMNYDDG
jgi:hypothetical protein